MKKVWVNLKQKEIEGHLSWKKDNMSHRSSLAQFKVIEENFEVFEDLEVKERDKTVWFSKINCSE